MALCTDRIGDAAFRGRTKRLTGSESSDRIIKFSFETQTVFDFDLSNKCKYESTSRLRESFHRYHDMITLSLEPTKMATCKNRSGVCTAGCVNEDIQLSDQRVSNWFKLNPKKLKVQISKYQLYSTLLKY